MVLGAVRWGVIGTGSVVEHKSGPALQGVPGSTVTAVMRRDTNLAADFARRHRIDRWYGDAQALVDDPQVDAVYVATPPDSHAEHTQRAAAAGKPVYVEKPMARTVAEAQAMVEACERAGVGLYVAYYRRALSRFVAVQQALATARIGQVEQVTVTLWRRSPGTGWRLDPAVSGGGLFVDLASHTLDWLDLVLGEVTGVQAEVTGGPAESTVTAAFRFASGVAGTGQWDFSAGEDRDEIALLGTEGSVRLSCFGTEPAVLTTGSRTVELEAVEPPVVQYPLIANVVDAIQGRAEPLSTGTTALRTTRVIDAVLADHRDRHGISFG